jgi:hypothetical protein
MRRQACQFLDQMVADSASDLGRAAGFRVTQASPSSTSGRGQGQRVTRAFCPNCGTMLFLRVSARPDLVAIRVDNLDDPSGFRPGQRPDNSVGWPSIPSYA